MNDTANPEPNARSGISPRSLGIFGLKLLVAGGALTWLLSSGRLDLSVLRRAGDRRYLGLASAMVLVGLLLPVWRWRWLLRVQQIHVSTWTAMRLTWLGYFTNLFLPGAAGGDLAKAYAACRYQPKAKTRAVSTVLIARIMGLHSLLFIGSISGLLVLSGGPKVRQAAVAWASILFLGLGSAVIFMLLWRRSSGPMLRLLPRRFRDPLRSSLRLYRQSWRRLVALWVYSALCNVPAIVSYVLAAAALGLTPTFALTLTVPLVIVANSIPLSPGGLGVGEAAGSQLFAEFGLAGGAMVVLIVRLALVCLSLPGALSLIWPVKRERRSKRGRGDGANGSKCAEVSQQV